MSNQPQDMRTTSDDLKRQLKEARFVHEFFTSMSVIDLEIVCRSTAHSWGDLVSVTHQSTNSLSSRSLRDSAWSVGSG